MSKPQRKQAYGTDLTTLVTMRLAPGQHRKLERAAKKEGVGKAQFIREVLFGSDTEKGVLS
jgi:hypothetical protein